ncbi:MAG: sigma-70 family RNA polymerase sigma factor [Planctomycetota bacterium]
MQQPDQQPVSNEAREQLYSEFVGLQARHDLAIRRFVRFVMPSADGVDDVMQETALECWKKFDEFRATGNNARADEFVRWACVIARYKALSWQRDRVRDRLVFSERVVTRLSESALDRVEGRQEERRAVEHCLTKLPSDQRRLVLSVHVPGESVANIARETGEKARRLYSRINTIRTRLMECVRQQLAGEAING